MNWREPFISFQNVQDLRNKFRTHFEVAMLPDDVWEAVTCFMSTWKEGGIKGSPSTNEGVKQTNLSPFLKYDHQEKKAKLFGLIKGTLSWQDIRPHNKRM